MTISKVPDRADEERGKIGPWDRAEVAEWCETFRTLKDATEELLARHDLGDVDYVAQHLPGLRRAFCEVTKALGGTVIAKAPELAAELAQSFAVYAAAQGTPAPAPLPEVAAFQPVTCAVLSTATRNVHGSDVDVALLRLTFNDPATGGPALVDAVLVRRVRSTDQRDVVHFPAGLAAMNFDQAIETRAVWLGLTDSEKCS